MPRYIYKWHPGCPDIGLEMILRKLQADGRPNKYVAWSPLWLVRCVGAGVTCWRAAGVTCGGAWVRCAGVRVTWWWGAGVRRIGAGRRGGHS